ncbi:MAG TPA: MlaD family protein [Solirubrobacteraceae bacterium]|nr:MlaD family protein [Solirubrobacteraceae bacterium]
MRRVAAITLGLAAIAAGAHAALADSTPSRGGGQYRVDAIFDTAKGIIPGQLVKVAGAQVGTVSDVKLTPDYKARIQLLVDRRFAPFRSDASCSIKPEALIAENFVQCDPGTPSGRPLKATGGKAPTVPLTRTAVPVSINDLFDIWNVPTRQRLTILFNELGAGFIGRGADLNALLLRSNPALAAVRRTLAIVNRQRAQLQRSVVATDRVVGELARRRGGVKRFIEQAARVSAQTAQRRAPLAESIRRLPALLRATDPALRDLDQVTANGTPVLADLRAAAPRVNRLVADVRPFSIAGLPALRALDPALRSGRRAVRSAGPVVAALRKFSAAALPTGQLLDELVVSMRDRGVVEGLLSFVYYAGSATARFDATSHIFPSHIIVNACTAYTQVPLAGCNARYTSPATTRSRRVAPAPAGGGPVRPPAPRSGGGEPKRGPSGSAPAPSNGAPPLDLSKIVPGVGPIIQGTLDGLLPQTKDLPKVLPRGLAPNAASPRSTRTDTARQGAMLDYLLRP